jgi:AcrR family transcriptional regulator
VDGGELDYRQRAAETKRRRTREQIIFATLDLYERSDGVDFTLSAIAEAAGVGVATLHNHFSSKFGLLSTAFDRLVEPIVRPIVAATNSRIYKPVDPVHELCDYVYRVSRVSCEHRALIGAMFRAYFENRGQGDGDQSSDLPRTLVQPISAGMKAILTIRPPFCDMADFGGAEYHCVGLLMMIEQFPKASARNLSKQMLGQLLPVVLANFDGDMAGILLAIGKSLGPDTWEDFNLNAPPKRSV